MTTSNRLHANRPLRALLALGSLTIALQVSAQTDPAAPPPPIGAKAAGAGASGPGMPPPPPQAGRPGERPMPGGPEGGPRGMRMPPESFAKVEATVTGYLLSPEAEVGGLMLDNGRQVRVPPHLSQQLADLVKPGERVRVDNAAPPAATPGDAPAPRAPLTITALASGRSIVDTPPAPGALPPPPPGQRPGQAALQPMKASGTVKQVLTGPRGETRGVVLDNGTQVAIPPHAAPQAAALLAVGARVDVDGYGRTTNYGTALQATTLGRPGEAPMAMYAAPLPR